MHGISLGYTDGKMNGSDEGIKLGSTDGKVFVIILGNVYESILGIYVVTYLGSLDGSFDGSNGGKLERLLLRDSLGFTDGKMYGSDKGIKLGSTDDKVFGTIIGDVDGLTLGIDIGTEMGYFDGFFDSSNHSKIEVLLLVGSLGYNEF